MRIFRPTLFLILAGAVLVEPAIANEPGGSTLGSSVNQVEIELRVRSFALDWGGQGTADQVLRHLSTSGVRLGLDGMERAAVPARQAAIALRDLRRAYETARAEVVRAAPVAGSPGRGFAELRWTTQTAGTAQSVVRSVYVGLVLEGGTWRIDEIRILP